MSERGGVIPYHASVKTLHFFQSIVNHLQRSNHIPKTDSLHQPSVLVKCEVQTRIISCDTVTPLDHII